MLALSILILFSSYAAASSSALPTAALAKSHLEANQPPVTPPISSHASAAIVLATQPLGILAAIPWNNLDAPVYPSVFSQLLILPTSDELSGQSIANAEADTSINEPIVKDALPQASDLAHAFVVSTDTHTEVGLSCTTCHSVPDSMYPLITTLNYQPSIQQQYHSGPIVDCTICHRQKPQQISWQFRGVQ